METHLDFAFARAPFEEFTSMYRRTKRRIEKEISFTGSHLKTMSKHKDKLERVQAKATLQALLRRLKTVRDITQKEYEREDALLLNIESRVRHLQDQPQYHKNRLNRSITEHFLRTSHPVLAQDFSQAAGVKDYVDFEIFAEASKILQDLKSHETLSALQWCDQHKSRLRKLNSPLEFSLKLQRFLECVKEGNLMGAIIYARAQFSQYTENQPEIQRAMMLLAIVNKRDQFKEYDDLFDESRWVSLQELFQKEMMAVYGLTTADPLTISLLSGLASIKTPLCERKDTKNDDCPACQPTFNSLVKELPYSHRAHTSLICRITHKLIDEHNPAVCLPNGQVYSAAGIESITNSQQMIVCPKTGEVYNSKQVKRVYIL